MLNEPGSESSVTGWSKLRRRLDTMQNDGNTLYEAIVQMVEEEIEGGQLQPGERLPPMRQLAEELGVSVTTVAAAYRLLGKRQRVYSEVGRGTFIAENYPESRGPSNLASWPAAARTPLVRQETRAMVPWRRRALKANTARLSAAHPNARDCTIGRPDSKLLPLALLMKGWQSAVARTSHQDLQYGTSDPVDSLADAVLPRLEADGIPARPGDLVVGSSAQQFLVLVMQIVGELQQQNLLIAVEEPGYATIFDTFERQGYELVGVAVDQYGAVPAALDQALAAGAAAVVLTPRAQNPTGASWSQERLSAIADVIAQYPRVVVAEDDHFAGVANPLPGSLIADRRLEERVVYIRSFSKSIAPDLRLAVAVTRSSLRASLAEAKTFADGWSSRLAQRALALTLSDGELDPFLRGVINEYAARRQGVYEGLRELGRMGGMVYPARDGMNVWIKLPPRVDALEVIEQAARLGVLVSLGEPFFIRPGRSDLLRCSIANISRDQAIEVGQRICEAIQSAPFSSALAIHV